MLLDTCACSASASRKLAASTNCSFLRYCDSYRVRSCGISYRLCTSIDVMACRSSSGVASTLVAAPRLTLTLPPQSRARGSLARACRSWIRAPSQAGLTSQQQYRHHSHPVSEHAGDRRGGSVWETSTISGNYPCSRIQDIDIARATALGRPHCHHDHAPR